jgi:hypothetical protein
MTRTILLLSRAAWLARPSAEAAMVSVACRFGMLAMAIALGSAAASAQPVSLAPPGSARGSTGPTFPDASADSSGATEVASVPESAAPIAGVNIGAKGQPGPSAPNTDIPNATPGLAGGPDNSPQR